MLGPFSLMEALFHPSARHSHQEQRRQEYDRADEGQGATGTLPVDLDSGRVVVVLGPERAPEAPA
ncbi:DUF6191 domain-containing protein [Streptomyces sp. 7-21]|uniref:DUF6191 domain-containing protein n=1 Tax=Streptomyces sp. 7-21 TaxID=2802283 RepID=UPI00191E051F|nr:DUF6191 domain-containing protein [Streptomyces sp. 7-21]MBL1065441.1 hypothetical protein [Streptomyces sp. 7-21]